MIGIKSGVRAAGLVVVVLCGVAAGSCSEKPAGVSNTPDGGTPYNGPVVTYYKDIQPLVATNCLGCHATGGIGPFDLSTYEAMKSHAGVAAAAVAARTMPPWMPSEAGRPLVDKRRLTDDQITLVKNWVAQGAPAGDPADAQNVQPPASTFRKDAAFPAAMPYAPNTALGTDDYHCFVLDSGLTADTAVTAFNVIPGDRRVVHHVILFGIAPEDQAELAQLQASGDGHGGYTCFGSSGVGNAVMVGGWVPGTQATTFPAGTGVVLSAGSKLVVQVHYNMLQVQDTTDSTEVQLQYAPAASVKKAYIIPILNTSFSVPPDTVKTITAQGSDVPNGIKLQVWGLIPHMHLHGTNINVVANFHDGSNETLIEIPRWDFHWQQLYFFEQPVTVQTGDTAVLSCTFDNTSANQPIVNGEQLPARTLHWGEDTLSEMCLTYIYATVK